MAIRDANLTSMISEQSGLSQSFTSTLIREIIQFQNKNSVNYQYILSDIRNLPEYESGRVMETTG
jgi:hypothetical protein